ncbi:hypothetical protein [Streptomyces sp. NPDC001401]|uniref:hypothetical protein n=1 Tax=Streptomyces sp. NPDC001401 TaxID=3364570 RepID=UPI0036BB76A0
MCLFTTRGSFVARIVGVLRRAVLRGMSYDGGSVTPEMVIWTAFGAALALAVTSLWGPQILAAARETLFK